MLKQLWPKERLSALSDRQILYEVRETLLSCCTWVLFFQMDNHIVGGFEGPMGSSPSHDVSFGLKRPSSSGLKISDITVSYGFQVASACSDLKQDFGSLVRG